MDETNKVSKIVIKKLKSKYKNYSDLIKNIEIIRYESDQYINYYYDDVIFTIGNVKCFIDRYLEDEKIEIKYSFCIIDKDDDENEEDDETLINDLIVTDNTEHLLNQNEYIQLAEFFRFNNIENINDMFEIIQDVGIHIKKYCKKYKTIGYY